jgi:hypothetical protein
MCGCVSKRISRASRRSALYAGPERTVAALEQQRVDCTLDLFAALEERVAGPALEALVASPAGAGGSRAG